MLPAKLAPLFSSSAEVPPWLGSALSLAVRLVLASVLLRFFFNSFLTKMDGFSLTIGAYAQILPKQIAAAGYDVSAISWPQYLVVLAGTVAELVLPVLVVAGVATRLSALGMVGFVVVMSLTDIFGHGVDAKTVGALFDGDPYGLILDQRLMWCTLLAVLIVTGGGRVSVDALVFRLFRTRADA
ncbi:DoxX family membrane protein [bacterium]|nr:DoxX family membrane protein [bacterium]